MARAPRWCTKAVTAISGENHLIVRSSKRARSSMVMGAALRRVLHRIGATSQESQLMTTSMGHTSKEMQTNTIPISRNSLSMPEPPNHPIRSGLLTTWEAHSSCSLVKNSFDSGKPHRPRRAQVKADLMKPRMRGPISSKLGRYMIIRETRKSNLLTAVIKIPTKICSSGSTASMIIRAAQIKQSRFQRPWPEMVEGGVGSTDRYTSKSAASSNPIFWQSNLR